MERQGERAGAGADAGEPVRRRLPLQRGLRSRGHPRFRRLFTGFSRGGRRPARPRRPPVRSLDGRGALSEPGAGRLLHPSRAFCVEGTGLEVLRPAEHRFVSSPWPPEPGVSSGGWWRSPVRGGFGAGSIAMGEVPGLVIPVAFPRPPGAGQPADPADPWPAPTWWCGWIGRRSPANPAGPGPSIFLQPAGGTTTSSPCARKAHPRRVLFLSDPRMKPASLGDGDLHLGVEPAPLRGATVALERARDGRQSSSFAGRPEVSFRHRGAAAGRPPPPAGPGGLAAGRQAPRGHPGGGRRRHPPAQPGDQRRHPGPAGGHRRDDVRDHPAGAAAGPASRSSSWPASPTS